MWLFLWDSEPSKIFVGDTPISKVFLWDTQARPVRWLPNTYQAVEWIQSSWTQYIDTGYTLTSNPWYDMVFEFVWWDSNSWIPMLWVRWSTTSTYCCLYINSNSLYVTPNYAWFDPWTSSWLTISKNTKYNIVEDAGQFYIDGVYKSGCSTTNTYYTANKPLYLFANNDYNWTVQYRGSSMKLYSFKLYNNWTLVRDFIPCYRKSDSVIWLYDRVNNSFYTNSWTGTFSKWADI